MRRLKELVSNKNFNVLKLEKLIHLISGCKKEKKLVSY